MSVIGYAMSSEEHAPNDLVQYAQRAEEIGFSYALISDHFHPWLHHQGHSPFIWSVIGAIAHATTTLRLGTGVTCPTIRIHPAIIAQAAATVATMMPGRFFLGVGTGENLNEHVLGDRWPPHDLRLAMLEEAIYVIRELWKGDEVTHRGEHYTVENARIYTLPEQLPEIMMAASGPLTAALAGRISDGLINTAPDADIVEAFVKTAGSTKPRFGKVTVCWAEDEATARRTAHEYWANTVLPGELGQELPTTSHFEQACTIVIEEDVADKLVCGPDAEQHLKHIREYIDAGYDHVYIHQVGPDQEGFFRFYEKHILPNI